MKSFSFYGTKGKAMFIAKVGASLSICSWICKTLSPLLLLIILIPGGCMPIHYAPNGHNVPLFTEKKQGNAMLALRFGAFTSGCDIQTAVSVSNHIGIIANYSYFRGSYSGDHFSLNQEDIKNSYRSNLWELGLGYYLPFEDKFLFDVYGGYGRNKIVNHYEDDYNYGNSTLWFSTYFIQPSIGFYKKHIQLAFSMRGRLVDYARYEAENGLSQSTVDQLEYILDNHNALFLEPALTFRAGGELAKFHMQIGISIHNGTWDFLDYDPVNFNMGVIFCFQGKKKSQPVQ